MSVTAAGCSCSSRAAPTTRSSPSTSWPRPTRAPSEQRRRFAADPTDRDALAGWVFGIGRNVLHEALRRGRAERRALARLGVDPPALEAEEQIRIEELAALGELRSAVQGALAELGPEQREAVSLRVVDELGYPAIALLLGISEQTARARVSRGLRVLAAAVDRHDTGAQGAS
jgi:RNA polymerase sigma-70 factor (ECF subfamily)